jgi:UDP-N-acetylmuramyl tripeptide synthase
MSKQPIIAIGKTARLISRLRGGGSALPGLVVEKLDPQFLGHTLAQLPLGVVVISGTNGKTTTTRMVVQLLESQGLRVFTNPTGSNFKRGIISAIIEKSRRGRLNYDIAVLELDEAHGALFVYDVQPRFCLLLNVTRDQLDRFGEIDTTRTMLQAIAQRTTTGVVLNAEDARIRAIAGLLEHQTIRFFGLSEKTRASFPGDDELYIPASTPATQALPVSDVVLKDFDGQSATFLLGHKAVSTKLKLSGAYNLFNAAAALALVRLICDNTLDEAKLITALAAVTPAFGRGEQLVVGGVPLELVLVKNPSGFRLGLSSFSPANSDTMIAVNDHYADGRDMSWLWDVDFSSLKQTGVAMVSGIRSYDMALRLQYDDVSINAVEPRLNTALAQFLASGQRPKRIFCTYTAMLHLRKTLAHYTTVERAL